MELLEVRIPQLGEGLREVRIVELRRRAGDSVQRGDALYVIETDKSTVELESPYDGHIVEWKVSADDIVPVNASVATIRAASVPKQAKVKSPSLARPRIPPRTRAHARNLGLTAVTLREIPAASEELTPSDVDVYLATSVIDKDDGTQHQDRKIEGSHRTLIYRLRRSANLVIPGTLAIEIPWSKLANVRVNKGGQKPTPFQVFCYAVAQVAREHKKFRSTMLGDGRSREYAHVNLGLAIARPHDTLLTAVIREADNLSLSDFVRACGQQIRAALKFGDQAADDIQILLTHLGEFGIVDAVPTLVAPASSIFFLGAPTKHADFVRVTLTFDHRLINGAAAAHFLESLTSSINDM